jgi:hypothetical protein
MDDLKSTFEKQCDFFTIEKKSDMRQSTMDYFSFFKRFAKDIEESLPKPVSKRAGANAK